MIRRIRHYSQFPRVIPDQKARSHALLTRPPLTPKGPLDLHVLSLPPAFVLSQDQTLKFESDLVDVCTFALCVSRRKLTRTHTCHCRSEDLCDW